MAGALRKAAEYLGLADTDERYDDYDDEGRDAPAAPGREAREQAAPPERSPGAEVTQLPRRTPVAHVVRPPEVGPMSRITTIHPRTYNEAKNIGEAFRDGIPVIINLTDMEDADAKRLVDFAAGLAFGLHGTIERVTNRVFLLSPEHVEVDSGAETGRAVQAPFNQS